MSLRNRYVVEQRGNSFVVYDRQEFRIIKWWSSNCLAVEQRRGAENQAKELNAESELKSVH